MSKIITVFGATGNQGGAVLKALLRTGQFHVRAVTRNANTDKAKQLAAQPNVSVAEADLDNYESVGKALEGAYGAFLVTDFTAHFVTGRETAQGKNAVDKAIKNGVKHFVFSGLENCEKALGRPVYHFDEKAVVDEYGLSQTDKISYTSIRMP
jgi:uncharacterized protein YbjT (DUF2867 family)